MFALSNLLLATGSLLSVTSLAGKTVVSNDTDIYRSDGSHIYHYPSNTFFYNNTVVYPIVSNTGIVYIVNIDGLLLDVTEPDPVILMGTLSLNTDCVSVYDGIVYHYDSGKLKKIDLTHPDLPGIFGGVPSSPPTSLGVVYEQLTMFVKSANNIWAVPFSDQTTIHKLSDSFVIDTIIDDAAIDTDILALIDSPNYLFGTTRTKLFRINKSSNSVIAVAVSGLATVSIPYLCYDSVSQNVIVSRYEDDKVSVYSTNLAFKYELVTNDKPNQPTVKDGVIYVACGAF